MQCTPLCSTQNGVLTPVDDAGDRTHPVIVSFMLQAAELDAASCCGLLLGFLILHVDVTNKHIQEERVRRVLMTDTDMLRNNQHQWILLYMPVYRASLYLSVNQI